MNVEKTRKKLDLASDIVDGIQYFKSKHSACVAQINLFSSCDFRAISRYKRHSEIYLKCIDRLEQRFKKQIETL